MAVPALVKQLGDTSNKTAGTTIALTTTGATSAGNLIVARIIFDNAATASKPVVSSITKMAGETANWVLLGAARSTSTSAGAFASGEMWAIQTTVAWSAAAYTVTLDTSVTQKAVAFAEFSGVQAVQRSTAGTNYSTTTTAASAVTTGTTPQVNDLAIGLIFGSNVAAVQAGSNNTTGGSWSAAVGFGSTGGSGATNNFGLGQYKVLTAGSHQTYANSAAMTAGNGAVVAILQSIPEPSITQAAYRFYADGTETGSTALAAQDTAPTVDVSSGDVNLQLRTRLQVTANAGQPGDDYQLQWERVGGTWIDAPTVVGVIDRQEITGGTVTLESSYRRAIGQTFRGNGSPLIGASFYVRRLGSPPASTLTVMLYAHTGTFGSNGRPTGAAVATSTTTIDVANIAATYSWVDFAFDGTFTLTDGTAYCVALVADVGGPNGSNCVQVSRGTIGNSALHPGNTFDSTDLTTWYSLSDDMTFRVTGKRTEFVTAFNSTNLTDGAATTNRLTGGTGSFVAGEVSETGLASDLLIPASSYTELLYSLTLKATDLADADTLRFRVLRNGATTGLTYTATPTINVTKAVGGGTVNGTATVTGAGAVIAAGSVSAPAPKIATLVDTFDSSLDTAVKWVGSDPGPVWDAGRVKIPCTTNYYRLISDYTSGYDLTGSALSAKVTPPSVGNGSREMFMELWTTNGSKGVGDLVNGLRMYVTGTTLSTRVDSSFGAAIDSHGTSYDPVEHAWWRIRESGGTIYFDTSPDGITWTEYWSRTQDFAVTNMTTYFVCGYYDTESAADGYVDNVNAVVGTTSATGFGSTAGLRLAGSGDYTAAYLPYTDPSSFVQFTVPISPSTAWMMLGHNLFSLTQSPAVTSYPGYAGYGSCMIGADYFGADGVTPVTNSGGHTGNGHGPYIELGMWSTIEDTWFQGGPNVHYVRFTITAEPGLAGGPIMARAFTFWQDDVQTATIDPLSFTLGINTEIVHAPFVRQIVAATVAGSGSTSATASVVGGAISGTATVAGVGTTSAAASVVLRSTATVTGASTVTALVTQIAGAAGGISTETLTLAATDASYLNYTFAIRILFDVAGTVRKAKFRRGAATDQNHAYTIRAWNESTQTEITNTGSIDTTNSVAGEYEGTFLAPISVTAGQTITFSLCGTAASQVIPYKITHTFTPTANVNVVGYTQGASSSPSSGFPSAGGTDAVMLTPIFETGGGGGGAGTISATGSVSVAVNGTAVVIGVGSINANANVASNGTATITGTGSTAALVTQRPAVIPITGVGTVNAVGYIRGTATTTGAGAVTTLAAQRPGTTLISGVGAISASALVIVPGTATVTGSGTTTALAVQQALSTVIGTGATTAAPSGAAAGTATVTGTGSVTALARQQATTAVIGTGTITAPAVQQPGPSVIAGLGLVAATATQRPDLTTITGTGSVTANANAASSGTATVAGIGTTTALTRQQPAVTALTGTGTTSASALVIVPGTASVTGSGTTTALAVQQAVSTINGVGAATAAPSETAAGAATVTGTGLVTALTRQQVIAAITGTGTVTALSAQQSGPITIAGTGTVSALSRQQAAASALGTGTSAALAKQIAPATVVGTGSVIAGGAITGAAVVTGTGTTAATARQSAPSQITGTGTVSAAGYITGNATVTGTGTVTAPAVLRSTSTVTGAGAVTATPVQTGTATVTGTGAVFAAANGAVTGIAAVIGTGSSTASVTLRSTSTVTGTGTVTATLTARGAATVTGTGTVTGTATLRPTTVTVAGLGSVSTTAKQIAGTSVVGTGLVIANPSGATTGLATIIGVGSVTATLTVTVSTGRPRVWTGADWVTKPAKVWSGTAWVEKPVKVWDGAVWEPAH